MQTCRESVNNFNNFTRKRCINFVISVIVLDVFTMKSSKQIEISKSTLIGLKAELAKKQEEVQKVTAQSENRYISAPVRKEKETVLTKQNAGVTERNERDIQQLDVEEIDLQRKSREILEAKSRLYDKLQHGEMTTDSKSLYLVDFEQKAVEESQSNVVAGCENKVSDDEATKTSDDDGDVSSAVDSEDDWVDYVDCFGRTRRCLRTDLEYMKSKDAEVSKKVEVNKTIPVDEQQPEMLSADMHREAMRQKWEEQERKLVEKGEIHYQDVLFDEARSHGVGYYNFSVDEEERRRQQAALSKLRKETVEEQSEKQRIQALRQQQLQARLKAAHRRRRERLGLPAEDENAEVQEQDTTESTAEKPDEVNQKDESVEDMERSLKRAAHVRPWDVGKDGVKPQSAPPVMTQEEWVEKKRDDRPSEFAPPPSYTTTDYEQSSSFEQSKKTLFFTSKKTRTPQEVEKSRAPVQLDNDDSDSDTDYGPSISDWKKQKLNVEGSETGQLGEEGATSGQSQIRQDLSDAISAGLNYLRQKAEIKQKKKAKGFLEII